MLPRNRDARKAPIEKELAASVCPKCRRPTSEPRRGLCFACYLRMYGARPVGAACEACGIADRRVLRRAELAEGPATLCANHAAIAADRMMTLRMLIADLFPAGQRRCGDRRSGTNRRSGERRITEAPGTDRPSTDRPSSGQAAAPLSHERRTGLDRRAASRRA